MKILITGSMGFIGGHLMKVLKGVHQVLGIDKKAGVDIANFKRMVAVVDKMLGKPDLIVHLAAQTSRKKSIDEPNQNFQDNVIGTFNVCELARLSKSRVIFASSRYADATPGSGLQWDQYGLSKYVGEIYLKTYAQNYGVEFIIDRIGNVYGPGQEGSQEAFWLAWFIEASIEKKPITIYGFEGKQSRCMLYISDLIDLLVDQINNFEKYRGGLFEVGGGVENEVSLIEALEFLHYDNYNFGAPLPGDVKRLVYDNKKVSAVNGWRPKVGWREGIKKTVEYYKKMRKRQRPRRQPNELG